MQERSLDDEILETDRVLLSRSLRDYVYEAWPLLEPARKFQSNWHIDAISDHLQAVADGHLRLLVINVPPGSTKSISACVMFPSWGWTRQVGTPGLVHAGASFIYASYSGDLTKRDSVKTRQLLETEWYKERWGHVWRPDKSVWGAFKYANDMGGFRYATSVAGQALGNHGDVQVVDDAIKPLDANQRRVDSAGIEKCIEWWDGTMPTRMRDQRTSARVIIMQRLHEKDLAGYVISRELGYEHLCLPMHYDPQRKARVFIRRRDPISGERGDPELFFEDPRTIEGELLDPQRFPEEEVKRLENELGPRGSAAQLEQRPAPAGGGIFKMEYFKHWKSVPRTNTFWIQSWDCAFKALDDSSWVVGQVWCQHGGDYYLIDQIRAHLTISGTAKAIAFMSGKWKKTFVKVVEDKANGPAVVQILRRKIPGLKLVNPQGGKEARANAVEGLWESGNVYTPDPKLAPWMTGFITEHINFGSGAADDQVDAGTQALIFLHSKTVSRYKKAMQNVAEGKAIPTGGGVVHVQR